MPFMRNLLGEFQFPNEYVTQKGFDLSRLNKDRNLGFRFTNVPRI